MKLSRYIGRFILGLSMVAIVTVGVLSIDGHQTKAAVTGSWQIPCFPYGNPDYAYGQYVSGWGYHVAEDVCGTAGTPVYAPANGTVVYSARTPDSYRWGNLIMIEHTNPDGYKVVSLFGHLGDNRTVGAGQEVSKGQILGYVGPDYTASNGNWGAHLHFGIHNGGYGYPVGAYAPWVHGYENGGVGGWLKPSDYVNVRRAAHDYVPIDVAGGGPMYYNGSYRVIFRLRNTGAATWQKDGNSANPVRLGTISPRDRGSGFAQNGSGWAGAARIKLENDTASGQVGIFSATFTSNQAPGSYHECFAPVLEGMGWFPERGMCTIVEVQPPGYRAEYVSQLFTESTDPATLTPTNRNDYLTPGQTVNGKALLKNVGELPWEKDGANPVRLGTANPLDRASRFATGGNGSIAASDNWPAYNRASTLDGRFDPTTGTVVPDTEITTGEIAVFSFALTAPEQPGNYQEYFQPMIEGRTWMNNLGMFFPLRVLDQGYHYQYVSHSGSVTAGLTTTYADVSLRLRNTGRMNWPVGGNVRLGTDRPMDNASPFHTGSGTGSWLAPSRPTAVDSNVSSPGKNTIDPGEVAEFTMRVTVPPVPKGDYQLYLRPMAEGVTWFPEDYGLHFPIKVTVAPYDYQVVRQELPSAPVATGSAANVRLAVKNTGRAPWATSGANAVNMGTNRPRDRVSPFFSGSGGDPWAAPTRASGIDGRIVNLNTWTSTPAAQINPGETALFDFPLSANVPPGSYREDFNLVAEGITWLPDYGVFIPVTVQNP